MPLRLTTWNVNGIRNPFSYQPWRENRTFERMFDILEADIVVLQETKIQKKDLRDDMVLIPGWDCFFSLPKHKKGYSGVVIYTRCSSCSPIRAEEGLTGVLSPPGTAAAYRELPEEHQIGGYPNTEQLGRLSIDPATLDSEGRCVILEFPAFVVLGVYCPAHRDESRDNFRLAFLDVLNMRVRNLVSMGKRVILLGDLNISRDVMDSAHTMEAIRKGRMTEPEFISAPSRRLFNQLIRGGSIGTRDAEEEKPVLLDICRKFHPNRLGMYTCWEQRVNARPGNYGARIDYVLCSVDMEDWFVDSNIQEGLMGSDHCPVYASINDTVVCHGSETHILDMMNSPGTFQDGIRKGPVSLSTLPLSGRLIPEFNRRRSVKDMFRTASGFGNRPALKATLAANPQKEHDARCIGSPPNSSAENKDMALECEDQRIFKRNIEEQNPTSTSKRPRIADAMPKNQQTLARFIKPTQPSHTSKSQQQDCSSSNPPRESKKDTEISRSQHTAESNSSDTFEPVVSTNNSQDSAGEATSFPGCASRESWAKLFAKKAAPTCEGHNEPCTVLITKKPGPNRGRSFWICPRPLGPSGEKEIGTSWRCSTFIWCSDWKSQGQM